MSDSFWIAVTIVGTCVFIFGASLALAPVVRKVRRARGIDVGPELPMSKQARTLAIICVGAALVTVLRMLAEDSGSLVLYVAAGAVFIAMMTLVIVLSRRDKQRARRDSVRGGSSGLGSSA